MSFNMNFSKSRGSLLQCLKFIPVFQILAAQEISEAIAAEVDARVQALFLAAEYEATKLESKRGNKQQKKEAARIRKEKKVAVKKAKAAAKVAAEARAAEKAEVEKLIKKYNFKVGFLYL